MEKPVHSSNISLRRTAKEIRRYQLTKKALRLIAFALLILTVMVYVITVMYTKFGSFTITINKFDNVDYSIALSEHANYTTPLVRLNCDALENITNIDGSNLPMEKLGMKDGRDSGENYLCYTFYLLNNGKQTVDIDYYMYIANDTQDLSSAMRVMIIKSRNGEERDVTTYAEAAYVDEYHNAVPEEGTVCFDDALTVMRDTIPAYAPGEIYKFTVVMWIEGPDKDCVDALIGGSFKVDMKFSVTGVSETD